MFPIWEIIIFAHSINHGKMKKIFDVDLLPEAAEFMDNLDEKTRKSFSYSNTRHT